MLAPRHVDRPSTRDDAADTPKSHRHRAPRARPLPSSSALPRRMARCASRRRRATSAATFGADESCAPSGARDQQPQRRIEIEQVVVGKRFAPELFGQRVRARQVKRRARLRILAVTQQRARAAASSASEPGKFAREQTRPPDSARSRHRIRPSVRRHASRARGARPRRDRRGSDDAHRLVLRWIDEHRHVLEVLCRGANQRDAADVDLFDRFVSVAPRAQPSLQTDRD